MRKLTTHGDAVCKNLKGTVYEFCGTTSQELLNDFFLGRQNE